MYFYSSIADDTPNLNNTYGDFNKVINYLIDGGTPYDIIKIEPIEKGKVKIYYDDLLTNPPWTQYMTIVVSGSLYYNKSFFIENIDTINKYVIAYNSTVEFDIGLIDESNTITARTIPCGATRKFGGVSDMRTVIKFADGIEYRIDDRDWTQLMASPVSAGALWTKVARICMAESFDNLDFASSRQFPYTQERPGENFAPVGNYIGQAVIAYNITNESDAYLHQNSYGKGANAWRIYASENFILVQMYTYGYSSGYAKHVMFGSFDRSDKTITNGILHTNRLNGAWNYTGGWQYPYNRNCSPCLFMTIDDRSTQWAVIYNNYNGNSSIDIAFSGTYSIGSSVPSGSGSSIPYPMNGQDLLYFSDVVLTNGNNIYGHMYDIKWINSNYLPSRDTLFEVDNELYITARFYSNTENSAVLIKLDRE